MTARRVVRHHTGETVASTATRSQRSRRPAPRRAPPRRRTGRSLLILLGVVVLAGAAGAVVVARAWPAVEITSDSEALAGVKLAPLGEGIDRIRVTDSQGRPVPVAVRSGRLWPKTTLPQGERLHVQVTVRRAGWVSWLVGKSEQVRMTVTTPEAHVTSSVLQPDASGFVRIPFDQPVRSATLAGPGIANGRLSFAVPKRLVATGVRAEGRNRAGVVRVSASPRSWESASAPVRVVWFPASDRPEALVRPAPGSELHPTDPIQLTFSQPVADLLGSDEPTLTPSTPGSWHTIDSHTIAFRPSGAGFGIGVRVAVALPHSVDVISGKSTLTGKTLSWEVPNGKTLRLQQLFAASGYLPLSWQPVGAGRAEDRGRPDRCRDRSAGRRVQLALPVDPGLAAQSLERGQLDDDHAGRRDGLRGRPRARGRRARRAEGLARRDRGRAGREAQGGGLQLRARAPQRAAAARAVARRHGRPPGAREHRRPRCADAARHARRCSSTSRSAR